MNTQLKNAAVENLKELLISNGVLDYYIEEVEKNHPKETKEKGTFEFMVEDPAAISGAFSWDFTPQGFDFWVQLNFRWKEIYKKLEEKYEND